jgi:hypothetical protein
VDRVNERKDVISGNHTPGQDLFRAPVMALSNALRFKAIFRRVQCLFGRVIWLVVVVSMSTLRPHINFRRPDFDTLVRSLSV